MFRLDESEELVDFALIVKRMRSTIAVGLVGVLTLFACWLGVVHDHGSDGDCHECLACVWQNLSADDSTSAPVVETTAQVSDSVVVFEPLVISFDLPLSSLERAPPFLG